MSKNKITQRLKDEYHINPVLYAKKNNFSIHSLRHTIQGYKLVKNIAHRLILDGFAGELIEIYGREKIEALM